MGKTFFLGLMGLSLLFTGCSSIKEKEPLLDSRKVMKADYVFLESKNEEDVKLIFRGIVNNKSVEVHLHQGMNDKKFEVGHWELIGFHYQAKDFEALKGGKRFVLRVKKNSSTYGGSFIVGCPKVPAEQNYLLKDMNFFDRYSFRSSKGLCEVIVGNQLKKIQMNLNISKESNELKVEEGF